MIYQGRDGSQGTLDGWLIDQTEAQLANAQEALRFMLFVARGRDGAPARAAAGVWEDQAGFAVLRRQMAPGAIHHLSFS